MNKNFSKYIISKLDCLPLNSGATNLVVFCHFDADNLIADYVVNYLQELQKANCDVVFVSNSNPDDVQIYKINELCQKVIVRENIGYDFAAYFTGYLEYSESLSKYSQVLFVNDSVFGPFYPLKEVFDKMSCKKQNEGFDMWGISDAYHKNYHIQSYFWAFKTSSKVLKILDDEANNYEFELPKKFVVARYEEGITQRMLKAEMKLGVLCSNAEAIDFEMNNTEDEGLIKLKADMVRIGKSKQSFSKKIKSLFSVKTNRSYNFNVPDANAYLTGVNSCWYSMIKYFSCPFIKVSMVKSANNFRYHGFKYITLLKELYPNYDCAMIEKHLKRIWKG